MPRRVTPAQAKRQIQQAINNYNRAVNDYNRKAKRAVNDYNREVRAHNARVRANRQRLNTEIARFNRQRSTTRYVTVQTSTVALHNAYAYVDEQSELWNPRGQELADMAEEEAANSAQLANTLLSNTAAGEEIEETTLTDELSSLSMDLHRRWEGARFALNPLNPDAARHFCTSAREVIVKLINMNAPDAAVLQAKPECARGPNGKDVARREKIGYLLDLNDAGYEPLGDFVEQDVNDVLNLFSQFNKGTHGDAGNFDLPALRAIKRRVENAIRFLSTLVHGSRR